MEFERDFEEGFRRELGDGGGTKPVNLVNFSHIPCIDSRASVLFSWSVELKSWSMDMNLQTKSTSSWLVFSSGVISQYVLICEIIAFAKFWSEGELSFGGHALVISIVVSMSLAIERDCTAIGKMALKKAPKAVQRK